MIKNEKFITIKRNAISKVIITARQALMDDARGIPASEGVRFDRRAQKKARKKPVRIWKIKKDLAATAEL